MLRVGTFIESNEDCTFRETWHRATQNCPFTSLASRTSLTVTLSHTRAVSTTHSLPDTRTDAHTPNALQHGVTIFDWRAQIKARV